MNKIRSFFTLLLLMIGLCLSTLQAQSYNSLWKQVEQAQKKSLPQTVVKLTGQTGKECSANAEGISLPGSLSGKTYAG